MYAKNKELCHNNELVQQQLTSAVHILLKLFKQDRHERIARPPIQSTLGVNNVSVNKIECPSHTVTNR